MTRPVALAVNSAGISEALRREPRWACWRYLLRAGRWTKGPHQPSGAMAKSDDPATWTTFEAVLAAYRTGRFDGICFVLGGGYGGLDVDGHTDLAGFDGVPGRRDRSPSGQGLHVVAQSNAIGGEINFRVDPPSFTRWAVPRFLALTGQDASGDPSADLTDLFTAWFPPTYPIPSSAREGYSLAGESTDDEILCAMIGGDDSDRIIALWRGDTSAYGDDHSRADQALVNHLAFWCDFDAERIDRLFRQSGLYRPKWDHKSYRRATLSKALR